MKNWLMGIAAVGAMLFGTTVAEAGRDLDQIKQRGTLRCGVQGPCPTIRHCVPIRTHICNTGQPRKGAPAR